MKNLGQRTQKGMEITNDVLSPRLLQNLQLPSLCYLCPSGQMIMNFHIVYA